MRPLYRWGNGGSEGLNEEHRGQKQQSWDGNRDPGPQSMCFQQARLPTRTPRLNAGRAGPVHITALFRKKEEGKGLGVLGKGIMEKQETGSTSPALPPLGRSCGNQLRPQAVSVRPASQCPQQRVRAPASA